MAALFAATTMTTAGHASMAIAGPRAAAPARATAVAFGDRGAGVMRVQQALIAAGLPLAGGADGYFGPATQRALKTFQKARGMTPSGTIDAATTAELGLGLPVKGERGAAVKRLQQMLLDAGTAPKGGADGVFGPATETALKTYQQSKGLPSTGAFDDATAVALGYTPQPAGVAPAGGAATASATATRNTPPAAAPAAPPAGYVRLGDRGAGVTRLQQALVTSGVGLAGGADGVFGNATAASLKRYQEALGLGGSGTLDQPTAAALGLGLPQLGDRGDAVRRLQQLLITGGTAIRGGADGAFGPVTTAALKTFQTVNGLPGTGVLDDTTAVKLGFAPIPKTVNGTPAAAPQSSVSLTTFPVQGPCGFIDTWLQPRPGGRAHQGVDVIAAEGNLVYAAVDGTISKRYWAYPGSRTGNGLRLSLDDGTYLFYAHLLDVAPGIDVGSKVRAGQVIGFVGKTGNAGTPHLHFEVHPNGGSAVNPYPLVKAIDACKVTDPLPQPG